jgi:2-polyprenyl-3-methyl-5-hydroxy-6-metoxy-1,4-benzoquinol methylase
MSTYNDGYYEKLVDSWSEISYPLISPEVVKILDKYTPANILDYGAGAGVYADVLSCRGAHVAACDISMQSVDKCNECKKYDEVFLLQQHESLAPDRYDMIFSSEVLEHVENCGNTVADWFAALKPGGVVFMTTTMYAPSVFTMFYEAKKGNSHPLSMLKEACLWLKGFWSSKTRMHFIRRWCYEPLGGHYHGFVAAELRQIFKKNGFTGVATNFANRLVSLRTISC